MKKYITAFSFIMISLLSLNSYAKNGELKSATSLSLSQAEELELLKEYLPESITFEESNLVPVQIYNVQGELVMEGIVVPGEEIENDELRKMLDKSEFLMKVDNTSLYSLEQ